jgi:hypothetical protein
VNASFRVTSPLTFRFFESYSSLSIARAMEPCSLTKNNEKRWPGSHRLLTAGTNPKPRLDFFGFIVFVIGCGR